MKVTSTEFLNTMDSIFEQPRTTPKPTPIAQNFKAPVVPEASLLLQNGPRDTRFVPKIGQNPPQSYNAWKLRNAPQIDAHDSFVTNKQPNGKENNNMCQNYANFQYAYVNKSPCDTSTNKSLMKKVRFEPPLVQPTSTVVMKSPNFSALLGNQKERNEPKVNQIPENKGINHSRVLSNYAAPLSNTYRFPLQSRNAQSYNDSLIDSYRTPENMRYRPQFNTKYPTTSGKPPVTTSPRYQVDNTQLKPTLNSNSPRYSAPYEQMYMGNTPNADLDLSLHDPIKNISKKLETSEALFEKSSLNCDGIKKFALPDHTLQAERQKNIQIQPILPRETQNNFLPDRKLLPHYSQQILPDRLLIMNNEHESTDQIVSNGSQQISNDFINTQSDIVEHKEERIQNKCSCDCKNIPDQTEKVVEKENPEDKSEPKIDPTVTELLNIVKEQNEQLHILQTQVQMLIKMNETNTKERLKETVESLTKLASKIDEKPLETERVKQVTIYNNQRQESERRQEAEREYRRERRRESDEQEYRREKNRRNRETVEHKRERNPPKNIVLYKDEQVGTSYDEGICRRITKGNIITKDAKTEKISVGIMTSFQVSVNNPYSKSPKQVTKSHRHRRDNQDSSSSISEEEYRYPEKVFTDTWHNKQSHSILENDTSTNQEMSIRDNNDYSLDEMGFGEPLRVHEAPLSPNHTVHVEMHDYDSDSEEETSSIDPGWTFYDNILGQVNNLLENSPAPNPRKENQRARRNAPKKVTDCTMEMVKQAQHLKKQGFAGGSKEFEEMNPKEISFAVKQLLMKYMSDEELANIADKNDGRMAEIEESDDSRKTNRFNQECRSNAPKGRNHRMVNNPGKQMKSSLRQRPTTNGAKILDITTLKKQPKLL